MTTPDVDHPDRATAPLGATFVRCSAQPVNHAGRCLVEGKIAEGLRELDPENLQGGLRHGIEQSARQVGVRPQFVEGLMPLSELLALGEKLKITQRNALHAWEQHAADTKPVADAAKVESPADASACLERLSRESDRPLALPLQVLAKDVGRWRQLLDVCGQRLDQGGLLERAQRQRLLRKAILFTSVTAITVSVCGVVYDAWTVRRRVAATLNATDACGVLSLSETDVAKSSTEQQREVQARRASCEEARLREQRALEEQRAREEQAREEERAKKKREERCDALAAHVEAGQLGPRDDSIAGPAADLVRRVASGTLQPSDFGPADPELPCAGTPAGSRLEAAWSRAVLAAPKSWANADDPSPKLCALLADRNAELPEDAKYFLLAHADEAARQALSIGAPARLGRAVRLCELKISLGLNEGLSCSSLLAIAREKPDSFGR